jgi:two-component system, NtrC family, sensor kinase
MTSVDGDPHGARSAAAPVEIADRALKQRPAFSIQMQIYLSVGILLLIVLASGLTTTATMARLEREVHLFQITSGFMMETEEARRYEKNFFLHGTGLEEALEHVERARRILVQNSEGLEETAGRKAYAEMLRRLARYEAVLDAHSGQGAPASRPSKAIEELVQRRGREMVSFAMSLEDQERKLVNRMLTLSRNVQHGLMGGLLAYIVLMVYMLVRRIVSPIRRFMDYTQRIAEGDHTPIMPRRWYRDEFSALAVAINHMLAELDRRQDILVQSHKLRAVGTLTAGVAHELNNPINNITLTAHMLLEDHTTLSQKEQQEMIRDIVQEAARTQRIVASLLDFARQSESKVEPLDLGSVAQQTLTLAQNQLTLKGVRAKLEVIPHLPRIHGDPQQLTQVVLNLILNAVEVTSRGGEIDLSVRPDRQEGFLALTVRDYGPGIPDHLLPQIFDPFFTTKARGKGTGLGLSIAQGIVAKHGGRLTVDTIVDQGSTFRVCLPVTSFPANIQEVRQEIEEGQRDDPLARLRGAQPSNTADKL